MTGNASKRRRAWQMPGVTAALALGLMVVGVTAPAHSQTDGKAPVVEEETAAAEEETTATEEETTVEVFTPPLFGAPEKRVGAGGDPIQVHALRQHSQLEDGVWIGAKSTVCPGVTCRSHSVLSVNSVAVTDLDSYGIYQGNPAKKAKERVMESSC